MFLSEVAEKSSHRINATYTIYGGIKQYFSLGLMGYKHKTIHYYPDRDLLNRDSRRVLRRRAANAAAIRYTLFQTILYNRSTPETSRTITISRSNT